VAAQARQFQPRLAAIGGAEEGGILDAGQDGVGIGERRFQVPDALKLPRTRRAVVVLMGAGDAFIGELVADGFPRLAAIVGTLDHLAEPGAALRGEEAVGVGGRTIDVIDFPAGEMGTADVPLLSFAVRSEDEAALAGTDQDPYTVCVRSHR